ncbi:2-C-methyl-D-erythritol 4-phosphate cytidylyltransferase [Desulfitispora alkaliphila]|uniref:2-C-methyl-D-erythritol 4-phosphate cytidylyltransferase n=1 Tax=Desulfitispora alkaliphila TaxID=622674 RepID=UPI003D1F5855
MTAIVPAAGQGRRMAVGYNKQYMQLNGMSIVGRTLYLLEESGMIDDIILVIPEQEINYAQKEVVEKMGLKKVRIVAGGSERQDSVYNGLKMIKNETKIVVVHDGVRPLLQLRHLEETILNAKKWGSAIVAVPSKDTIKIADEDKFVKETPPRANIFQAQTPQVFKKELIQDAYERAAELGYRGTDDASLVEWAGYKVKIVEGSYENLKITTPEDLLVAETILKEREE